MRDKVIVAGDAAATAANLMSMETLWRAGIATEVLMAIATVMLAMVVMSHLTARPPRLHRAGRNMFVNEPDGV